MPDAPLFIAHEIYRNSRYGTTHPLSIPRVSACMDLVRALGWLPESQFVESPQASPEALARFHDPAYVAALHAAEVAQAVPEVLRERHNIGVNGNPIYPEMYRRPATACGGTLKAVDLVLGGGVVHHPAGGTHHGRPDRANGFCYFNDPVLGLLALLDAGIAPLAYVDLDAHHGDGVQDAFHGDPRVLVISIHERDRWPRTGPETDRGGGWARNLPMPTELNDSEHAWVMDNAVLALVSAWKPEALVVQCGADGLADDPQSRMELSNGALWRAVSGLLPLAPRVILLGGGGYNPWSVARCWAGIWGTVAGQAIPSRLPAEAESLLRTVHWNHRRGRTPPEHWFTTLADPPNPGPVRADVKRVVETVMGIG
ncbi:MAG: acetoin utilization protein AcuC [Rhodospirillum sp.]|nr:acetoin utilization protein AcuC [Rhodospirillum sp.]MCF8487801.1 acetoin utilization protein AcuC [Rhodospirillum sp.]MCF8499899.1 acetoin utilization protein AcuC [Rhodospirillum sp.]